MSLETVSHSTHASYLLRGPALPVHRLLYGFAVHCHVEITTGIDADAAAGFIIDAWEGAALRAKALGDGAPVDHATQFVLSRFLN